MGNGASDLGGAPGEKKKDDAPKKKKLVFFGEKRVF